MANDTSPELDATDRQIIDELTNDGRVSIRTLADRTHISRANAYARVERLTSSGVIRGFTARIAHDRAGLTTSAFVAMSIRQDAWRGLSDQLAKLAFVDHFGLLGGDIDVLVLVRAPDNHALREVVLEQLHALPGVQSTNTWLIFDESDGPGLYRT